MRHTAKIMVSMLAVFILLVTSGCGCPEEVQKKFRRTGAARDT